MAKGSWQASAVGVVVNVHVLAIGRCRNNRILLSKVPTGTGTRFVGRMTRLKNTEPAKILGPRPCTKLPTFRISAPLSRSPSHQDSGSHQTSFTNLLTFADITHMKARTRFVMWKQSSRRISV